MADEDIKRLSKVEAIALGENRYWTGELCTKGHDSPRRIKGNACVECMNENRKRWRSEHPERTNEIHREWRKKNPEKERESQEKSRKKYYDKFSDIIKDRKRKKYHENIDSSREVAREASRKFRENNKETYTKYVKAWRKRNPDKHRELEREIYLRWSRNNPEAARAKNAANWARRKNAEGKHTAEDIKKIYKMQSGKCAYCKKNLDNKYQIDHIYPLSKGGTNYPSNIQLLCPQIDGNGCNQKKSDMDPMDYARYLGYLL